MEDCGSYFDGMAFIRRGKKNTIYFVKRVPKEFEKLDRRGVVQISLKTDSEAIARTKAADVEAQLQAYWIALSEDRGVAKRYSAMVKLAASRGLKHRPPFAIEWIKTHFTENRVTGPNAQARDIFFTVINTGCRPSEIAGLMPDDIVLDHAIPHIKIRANSARDLKSPASERDIPMVGISLRAITRHPNGFPNYAGRDRFSDDMNRYLRRLGLFETGNHTVYGLRHSFEDRLLAIGVQDRMAADLMGHSTSRERYGTGATLAQKLEVLNRLAL